MNVEYALQSLRLGKTHRFFCGDGEHDSFTGHEPVAKGHDENSARREKGGDDRHGNSPFVFIEVHPYGREHDEAELVPSLCDAIQPWKSIVHPLDERRRVVPETVFSERLGRLDSYDLMALPR